MAVYFDNRIQSSSVTANTDLLWHDKYALLAVASENSGGVGGAVNFYLDEGELLEESSLQRSSLVSSMSWHPVRKIIAVGWASGELLIWNEHDKDLHEVYSVHKGKVKIAKWSPNGERLVTGDEEGLLAIWKADNRGRLSQTPLYQHDCSSAITYCLFKPNTGQDHAMDITSLARAAVNGDERALDMFAWTKGKRPLANSSATNTFFFGTADGNVFFVDDKGHSKTSFAVDASVKILLYYEAKDVLVTVTENMMLTQHSLEHDGSTKEIMKVKISGGFADSCIIWAGSGVLANASGENVVRILDLEQNDNYVLSLDMAGYDKGESVTSISYSRVKGILAGGTNLGKVAMWKSAKNKTGIHIDGEKRWELLPPSVINEPVLQVQWGGGKGLLGANVGSSVVILNEQVMNVHFNNMVAAIQISPSQLTIENFATDFCQDLKTDIHIKGVFILKDHAIVWDGKRVVVYEVSADITMVRAAGSFSSDSFTVVAHDQSVYTVEPGKIQVRNFQGTVKQVLSFHDTEGEPMLIDICGSFLVAATTLGFIKMWDLSRREAKQHGMCRSFEAQVPGVGKIKSAKINCNGTKVCIICEKDESTNDPRLFIWDVELDVVQIFDFSTGRNDQITEQENRDDRFDQVSGRYPMLQYWDPTEPKLLSCQAVLAPVTVVSGNEGAKPKDVSHQNIADVLIVTLYHTPENGIILLDHFVEEEQYTGFLGVQIPYFYFSVKRTEALEEKKDVGGTFVPLGPHRMTTRRTMKDFIGLEDASSEAKQAMMDFSYLSAIGNMDEAFKAIKLIKSESVWQNMARMCVKTKRLDVASVCLGNMKNARAAKALKKAMKEPELDARVAMLAIQLNMLDEAERLYKSCKRFDLLNEFYQARNEWSKAVEVAELYDRVHLRTTYHNFAKFLESSGNIQAAITNYEKSDTFRFEVPRMLLENPNQLESYIMKTKDKALRKWWAQYMESNSEMDVALKYYEAANDILSLVRVYCFCGNIEKAAEICNETGDRAASYHLARQFENQDSVREAIHFYTRAQCYSNAIRLAKENDMDNDLMNLALLSKPQDMIDVARYYESMPNMLDKAVVLYHKGGEVSKAVDLCFQSEQFTTLQMVAEDLTENTDPEMLAKCSEFFMEHGQYDKAVDLAVLGKKYVEAMDLCLKYNVIITEELAEKMTLSKDSKDTELRNKILERIAECCMQQGSYHLATKKFTQAGNRLKGMKALLKSGDTEKIVFFAGVSRQREIYVMAANYLQSLDWRKDPDIMKNIISFYTKGRALDSLASFYDACAQVEIDEFQNYEKALGALSESYKCLGRVKTKDGQEEKMAFVKQRVMLIKKFIQARRSFENDSQDAMKQCQLLLEDPDLETAVRIGDVYGLMIEYLAMREQNYSKAYALIEDLRNRVPSANLTFYVDTKTLEVIHKSLNIPLRPDVIANEKPMMNGGGSGGSEDEGEILDEEVEEDIQNGYD